ncbi:MAG: glycosyltransferase family 4 protein [bacterium]|nr:glycosyltransferase family 4 protein [bacterium]
MSWIFLHPFINACGGAERQTLELLELAEKFCDPILLTAEKPNEEKIEQLLGKQLPCSVVWLAEKLRQQEYPLALFRLLRLTLRLKQTGHKIFLCQGEFDLLVPAADVAYYQALPFSRLPPDILFYNPFARICYNIITAAKFRKPKLALVNSAFLAQQLNLKHYLIIYPLVKIKREPSKKEETVLVIGKFTLRKAFHRALVLASLLDQFNYKLILAGKIVTKDYYQRIVTLASKFSNVKVISDPSPTTVKQLQETADIALQLMDNEAFGITVLEAIYARAVPVVSKFSGAWTDILEEKQFVYGAAFSTLIELKSTVRKLIEDKGLKEEIRRRLKKVEEKFNYEKLKLQAMKVLEKVLAS